MLQHFRTSAPPFHPLSFCITCIFCSHYAYTLWNHYYHSALSSFYRFLSYESRALKLYPSLIVHSRAEMRTILYGKKAANLYTQAFVQNTQARALYQESEDTTIGAAPATSGITSTTVIKRLWIPTKCSGVCQSGASNGSA
jgi:hypothetical protein